MAIDAKQNMLMRIERECADFVTVQDMPKILRVISDVMDGFDITQRMLKDWDGSDDDMLKAYIATMKIQGRSEKTIRQYKYIIGKFMEHTKVRTREVNVYHIRAWLADEQERGIKDSTMESRRQVLSAFFGWIHREGLIERNPMSNVGTIKVAKRMKKTYSGVEIDKLNKCCTTLRDRAILHFLRSTGCRISEMTELNRDQVDLEKLVGVVHGKGNKERRIYLDDVAGECLKEYLDSRKDDGPELFSGRRGRINPGGVRMMLKKLGKAAGVENVHPHRFRRTLATSLARKGMQVQEVAFILGHEKLDTTMRYVNRDDQDVQNNYRRFAG